MNRLVNLALSVGETLVHESGRLLFGIGRRNFWVRPSSSEPGTWR